MQCPHCGSSVDDISTECPRCGIVFSKVGQHHVPPPPPPPKRPMGTLYFVFGMLGAFLAICVIAAWLSSLRANAGWYRGASGYDRALAEHNTTHKPMLVYFYTDWCPYCRQLDSGILSRAEFRTRYASFVKVKINPEKGARESDIAHQFQIRGFPTVFRMDEGQTPQQIPVFVHAEDFFAAIDGNPTHDAMQSGWSLLDRGKNAEATEQFERASKMFPNDPRPHVMRGIALYQQGHRVEAEYELKKAISMKPDPTAYDYLASIALDKGAWTDALDDSRALINLDPRFGNGQGYYMRALAYWNLGETYEAFNDADRACSMGHRDACNVREQLRHAR